MATSNTQTTVNSAKAWSPDISVFDARQAVPTALLMQHSNVLGEIRGDEPSLRVAFVQDDDAKVYAEGAEFDEDNPTLAETVVTTIKIGQLLRISREQFTTQGTAAELSASVSRAIIKKADELFIASTTAPKGLMKITNIEDGGAVADSLDALVDLDALLRANGGDPTGVLLSPTAWARIRKLKTGTGSNATLVGEGVDAAEPRLLGLNVSVTNALGAGEGMIVDRSAVVAAAGAVIVAQSDQRYFETDSIGLRATWRVGWNAVYPDRLGKFSVTDADL